MYLQITTKCNMSCAHCCYSCTHRGKHADYNTLMQAIICASEHDDETITIGGGEPTLHPRFFDILAECLTMFSYVWLATNGSQTNAMFRLSNILDGEDCPECECSEEDIENGFCNCYENAIWQENKLGVALSQDPFHDPIDQRIVDIWRRHTQRHAPSGYEIRDVSNHVINQGRAVRTQIGQEKGCPCPDLVIKPNGKIRACGCTRSPCIGDIWNGFTSEWEEIIYDHEGFNDERCYKAIKPKDRPST